MNKSLALFVKALSDDTRIEMLHYLKRDCCAGDLGARLDLPQNLASHHLKVLSQAKLISGRKQGVKRVYQLNSALLKQRLDQLERYLT